MEVGRRLVAVIFLVILGAAGATAEHDRQLAGRQRPKANAFFVFGDSYADTGNLPKNTQSWLPPYGVTWPGAPTGRFGNGRIQPDYLAQIFGVPSPTPYVLSAVQNIKRGINFALGGAGVTFARGIPPIGTQIDYFEIVLQTGMYSPSFLAEAVVLVSNVGNDYAFISGANATDISNLVRIVQDGLYLSLRRLYDLGFRNVLVSNTPPVGCMPAQTKAVNYTLCDSNAGPFTLYNNALLSESIAKLNTLPDANFVTLNMNAALTTILNNPANSGITKPLVPCCLPVNSSYVCGDKDASGNPLYTVCSDPTNYTYWDDNHLQESTWRIITGLYRRTPGFIDGASNLQTWLADIESKPSSPLAAAPTPEPTGAEEQLDTAYAALISKPNYTEAIGLLQAINIDRQLAGLPEQMVTVFLPYDPAFYVSNSTRKAINDVYIKDQIAEVLAFHVVKGYYDAAQLSSGAVKTLVTVSGQQLHVQLLNTGIYIGPQVALVINPALYDVKGQAIVHGVNKILFPPGTGP